MLRRTAVLWYPGSQGWGSSVIGPIASWSRLGDKEKQKQRECEFISESSKSEGSRALLAKEN